MCTRSRAKTLTTFLEMKEPVSFSGICTNLLEDEIWVRTGKVKPQVFGPYQSVIGNIKLYSICFFKFQRYRIYFRRFNSYNRHGDL